MRKLLIFKKLAQSYYNYYMESPKQLFVISKGFNLECDTAELGQFVWHRLLPIVGTQPYPPHELMLMCAATLWLRPKLIVEWGTGIGVSSRIFHEANIHYNIGAEIHSIDLPDHISHVEHPSSRRGILVRGLPMYLHQGDGATIASSLLKNKDVHTPLIFIDGDHAKDSVLRDCRTILNVAPKVGLLLHDTFYQPKSNYNHGPYEAIQELLKDLGESVQIIEFGLGCPGMTFLLPL